MGQSTTTTEGVRVHVSAIYVPERSQPERELYFFSYTVTISNEGPKPARLLSRHWVITDGAGRVEHVKGPGVVGEHPLLKSGESFEYTSYCPLSTPSGSMQGQYQMERLDGQRFNVEIGAFSLEMPHALN